MPRTRAAVKRRVTGLWQNVLHKSILAIVCTFLPLRSLVVATCTSKQWQKDTVGCPYLWANLDFNPFSSLSIAPHRAVVGLVQRAGRSLQSLRVDMRDWSGTQQDSLWKQIMTQNPLDFRLLMVYTMTNSTSLAEGVAQLVERTNLKRFSNGTIFDHGWHTLPMQLTINGASVMDRPCVTGRLCSSAYAYVDGDAKRKRCCAICGVVKCVACSYMVAWNEPGWQFECLQCLRCFCIQCGFPDFRAFPFAHRPPRCCYTCKNVDGM